MSDASSLVSSTFNLQYPSTFEASISLNPPTL
jgi:hypothetical protein